MKHYGYLGSDVSKGYCDFYFIDSSGQKLSDPFQLDDTSAGHKELLERLNNAILDKSLDKIIIGLESTGGYENNWYFKLRNRSTRSLFEVYRINPKRIYHTGKVEGVLTTNDRVSARTIASYLIKNYGKNDLSPHRHEATNDDTLHERKLYKYIQHHKRNNARLKVMMEKNLYISMPELLAIKGEKYSGWFLSLLCRYPSRRSILKAGIEGLVKIKHLSRAKAQSIVNSLRDSVNQEHDPTLAFLIRDLAKQIREGEQKVKKLNTLFLSIVEKQRKKDLDIVASIRGISPVSAAALLLEYGDINKYENSKNVVAFFGTHPTYRSSGDQQYKKGMSKAGSATARAVLYMAAKNVVIHEPYFKSLYIKYKQKGRSYNDVMGIIMSKLARVIYGMLKKQQSFDPGVDQYHQSNIKYNQNIKEKEKPKVHQGDRSKAPISWRERRKRKQEQRVQS